MEELYEDSMYGMDEIGELMESDEISIAEEAFLRGYLDEAS